MMLLDVPHQVSHLEYGESVEECANRELLEETGLTAKSLTFGFIRMM